MKLVPVFCVAAFPAASLTSTAIVYEVPLTRLAMSEAAYVTSQVFPVSEQVSETPFIVVVTV